MKEIDQLLEISHFYGNNKDYVIAGGGNTSYKTENTLWIKASGHALATLTEDGLVEMSRESLKKISTKTYPTDTVAREDEVKKDLYRSIIDPTLNRRPSVETSLHEMIKYKFIVHTHPTHINGILCSKNARETTKKLFGDSVLFVPYTDPGYTLFKRLENDIKEYRQKFNAEPQIIFLENHGVFAGADSIEEIKSIYNKITDTISVELPKISGIRQLPYNEMMHNVLPRLRVMLSGDSRKIIRFRHNSLIAKYYINQTEFDKIALPLTPDIIVYCKTRYIYVENVSSADEIINTIKLQIPKFINDYGFQPKIFVIKNMGVFVAENSFAAAESVLDVYEDLIKISTYALQCGGIKALSAKEISFIDKWEVENYRRKVAVSNSQNKLANKTAIVTGGAQGFGAGIVEGLFKQKMNIMIADLNEKTGIPFAEKLNGDKSYKGKVAFFKTDVSNPTSVEDMIKATVREFGGIDLMVSNAGVLRAGSLNDMNPETFEWATKINYFGFFYCSKFASTVMKAQNMENPNYFSDIIQINSKSGLRGSNKNFTYAGAKFGGIGLVQSFALELAPYKIKVNAICPGNFYNGPLWSDPENGLFIQYLKAGKVAGAKTVDDVREYYMAQAPMKRGCETDDVLKALLYIVDQEYETGQAVPVTGGQVMLS